MRNIRQPKSKDIISIVADLPYFNIDNFSTIEKNKHYLKIILSRYQKSGKVIRLKKGVYVSKYYVDKMEKSNNFFVFSEFITNLLYSPSYLSIDYVLYENNLLTEFPTNFTSVSINKTTRLSNRFGNFIYHKITNNLFIGFNLKKIGNFTIYKATKNKALFDYFYLRKNLLPDEESIKELRLNLYHLKEKDIKEIKKYVNIEGSRKMQIIFDNIVKLWK